MNFNPELIVSQGRLADRTTRTLAGAALVGHALEQRYGWESHYIANGTSHVPADDKWPVSLALASDNLVAMSRVVETSIAGGHLPIVVANTCCVGLASLPAAARMVPNMAVLWIDAHGDFNTPETTTSGYLGGMVLAGVAGLWRTGHGAGIDPKRIVLVGARDIDPEEARLLQIAGVRNVSPSRATPSAVIDALAGARVWLHVDWDVLEPGYVQAEYAVANGLLPDQLKQIFAAISPASLVGVEIAEFCPGDDADENGRNINTILDIMSPVLESVPHFPYPTSAALR